MWSRFSMESLKGEEDSIVVKDITFPREEIPSLKPRTRIVTHRVSDDSEKFDKGDMVYAQQIDENYCYLIVDKQVLTKVEQSPYLKDLTEGQIKFLSKFDKISVLTLRKTDYERPYKLSFIKEHYPKKVYEMLKKDRVHSWRAQTGIEVIHLEPTKDEQTRIFKNWKLMTAPMKKRSDEFCKQIFGVTNLENHEIVKDERNISDDSVFKDVISKYMQLFKFDLSYLRLISTKTPRYTNGYPAKFPLEQFGGCWTKLGVVYLNSDLAPVVKFYGLKDKSTTNLKRVLIAHELAHDIYNNHASDEFKQKYVDKAKEENFTTPYLDHVRENKLREETFCEYMAAIITGKAEK